MEASVTGSGAVVRRVLPDTPADGALRPGDVIIAIEGRPVTTTDDLRRVIVSQPPGTTFGVEVKRSGGARTVEVTSARLDEFAGPAFGIMIANAGLEVDLPFDVTFTERPIGGPSAGLAFALAIADMIDEIDYARGRTIAVTGTIDGSGDVGPVGGVDAKAVAAEDAGATLFLVPPADVARLEGDLDVRGVGTLEEALDALTSRQA
jgi:Lon-like protease